MLEEDDLIQLLAEPLIYNILMIRFWISGRSANLYDKALPVVYIV